MKVLDLPEFKGCKGLEGEERIACERKVMREMYGGRFHEMADKVHIFLSKLDKQTLPKFRDLTLKDVAEAFGRVEHLRTDF